MESRLKTYILDDAKQLPKLRKRRTAMRTFKLFTLVVLTAMHLVACGDDVTKVTNVTQESFGLEIVSSADSLGKCTVERSGEMKFVSTENAAFVCTDSAWQNVSAAGRDGADGANGKDGKDGASCVAEPLEDSSGLKVVCGEDSVGLVLNGSDGKDGTDGKAGEKGSDGNGCTLSDYGDGTVLQICGKDSVLFYKARCGTRAYNPDSNFCFGDSVVSLCGGKSYDISREFCDFRDGRVYKFTVIGSQTWMAENAGFENGLRNNTCLDNLDSCTKFGRLYTRLNAENACPEGWHLPTEAEWDILMNYVDKRNGDDNVGTSLKSRTDWENGENGLDEFGFNALPAGHAAIKSSKSYSIVDIGKSADFWTASRYCDDAGGGISFCIGDLFVSLLADNSSLLKKREPELSGALYSVRCVKD